MPVNNVSDTFAGSARHVYFLVNFTQETCKKEPDNKSRKCITIVFQFPHKARSSAKHPATRRAEYILSCP